MKHRIKFNAEDLQMK